MAQRYDIVRINFQANARGANAAIESIRQKADECNAKVELLKQDIKSAVSANMPADHIEGLRKQLRGAEKDAKQFGNAYKELVKGMRTLDEGIQAFNSGTLNQMNAAFQKALYNAAKLTKTRLDPTSDTYKRDSRELTAVMDAAKQNYARLQGDAAEMVKNLKNGSKVSVSALREELKAQQELLEVLSETDKGYQRTQKNVAVMSQYLRAMGGDYEFIRKNITDTKKVSDDMLRSMYAELEKTNSEGKVTRDILRENARAMKEIRAEQANRVQNVLGSDLGKQSEGSIRAAIASAKELLATYESGGKKAKALAAQIVNAEEHLKQYGVEAERTARKEAAAVAETARKRQEADRLMQTQLLSGRAASESALKAQQQYWQRLIDDPKTASQSLQQYKANLAEVEKQQMAMVTGKGKAALNFFRGDTSNASADEIKRNADALKAYRNSLPQQNNAQLIAEIDALLLKAGQSAKEAARSVMSLSDAETLAGKLGTKGFSASTNQLNAAKKALEEAQAAAGRGGKRFNELQAAINKVDIELRRTGEVTAEVKAVLDQPKGRSFNELKQAVEQGRAALQNMRRVTVQEQKDFDELAKKVKAADIEMKQLGATSKGTASSFDKAWSRLKTYIGLYMGAAVAIQKLTATMGDLMELSDKMGEVRKTTGFTAEEVGRLSGELKKLDTRTALTGLMELSVSAGQLGLKTERDVLGFTEAANKLMVALPEMGREGATEMLKVALATGEIDKIGKQMSQGLISGTSATAVAMEKVGSTIDRLRATSAATAPAITDFVKRVGAVGAQSGITIDQVAALGSTVDSLGMRVEMSATALSRMIPAIRNNAFAVAKAIGVAPEELRSLFDAGRGMEAILMILQHIKDAGMGEDSIEKMLGIGGMQDVMKELNQQGARAGIVFAGLSQNVDELRRQLGVASEAYEENIAIQQEYDKMNETTAAKWERLKNQLEEAFIGDTAQRMLGGLIDALRGLVNFLTGNVGPALKFISGLVQVFLMYWAVLKVGLGEGIFVKAAGGLKSMAAGLTGLIANTRRYLIYSRLLSAAQLELRTATNATSVALAKQKIATIEARMAQAGLNKAMMANVWTALAAAIGFGVYKLIEWGKATREAAAETGRFHQQLSDSQKALDDQFTSLQKMNQAQEERSKLISEINSKYSKYLGYMLSETASAEQLAAAHALIAQRIREEAYERRLAEKERKIYEEHDEDVNEGYGGIVGVVQEYAKGNADVHAISDTFKKLIDKNLDNVSIGTFALEYQEEFKKTINGAIERLIADRKISRYAEEDLKYAIARYTEAAKHRDDDLKKSTAGIRADLRGIQSAIKTDLTNNLNSLINNVANSVNRQPAATGNQGPLRPQGNNQQGFSMLNTPWKQGNVGSWTAPWQQNSVTAPQQQMAPIGWTQNINKKNLNEVKAFVEAQDQLRSDLETNMQSYTDEQRKVAQSWLLSKEELDKYRKLLNTGNGGGGGGGGRNASNPWGSNQEAESTDWKNMTADVLVSRRKQMNEFVKSIQTDTDVQTVLKEDSALKKAIEKGMSSDMRTVINWYNTERLKIQDELHSRHLTNTGDWMDPKKQKARHKQFKDEIRAYLEELDAYYTERKTRIQEAGNEEGISEGEVWQRTIQNETEWRQRRAELQKMYSEHDIEVTAEEQDAIRKIIAERTGDTTEYITASIERTRKYADSVRKRDRNGAAEYEKWMANLGLGWEKDYLKQQNAIAKQVKAINDIISKERPFNGITENMQENLVKMGILTADMTAERDRLMDSGEDMTKFNLRQAEEQLKRTTWLLGEAENAYALTAEQMVEDMRNAGFGDWADTIEKDDSMKRAMLAQLHSTYDAVQDAIKKESSLIKKQVEIQWNDILSPDGKSMRQTFDEVISKLGLMGDQVKRANSLINAGYYSERVADKLAIKQMQVRLQMQEVYYNNVRKIGNERIADLKKQAKEARERGEIEKATRLELDAQHAATSLNLSLSEEQKKVDEQRVAIQNQLEESQNRLYQSLREWATLLNDSVRSMFEASHAWDAEFYNERAKLNLTGKGGPGAGTYVIIENAGTSDAEAHYEYLDEREALDRQHEIEIQNAQAEAFRKMMDDLNMKMSEQITDSINAMLQDAAINNNTDRLMENTAAIAGLNDRLSQGINVNLGGGDAMFGTGGGANPLEGFDETNPETWPRAMRKRAGYSVDENPHDFTDGEGATSIFLNPGEEGGINWMYEQSAEAAELSAERQVAAIDKVKYALSEQFNKQKEGTDETSKHTVTSTQSMYAKMTQAANLYGIAYQAMSNENLSMTQRMEMIGIQAAGNAAIAMLTAESTERMTETEATLPSILAKCLNINPIYGAAIFAALTAVIGGLMGMAMAKVSKGKSQIAQATGVSVGAGRLSTGMLTYAEGNVNEFTDPATLTPGRSYDVDGADGKTYHARYMGKNAKTHITNGPEFHLVGEAGREAIIDAKTTRQIQMDEPGIWSAIQTLYRGGRITSTRRRSGRGMPAFADGNIDEFAGSESTLDGGVSGNMGMEQMTAFQQSLDRNNELLERALTEGIKAVNKWDGPDGIPNMYNKYQKQAQRHGERYL